MRFSWTEVLLILLFQNALTTILVRYTGTNSWIAILVMPIAMFALLSATSPEASDDRAFRREIKRQRDREKMDRYCQKIKDDFEIEQAKRNIVRKEPSMGG